MHSLCLNYGGENMRLHLVSQMNLQVRMHNKILLIGDWHSQIHEVPFAEGLNKAGLEVTTFKWLL